MKTCFAIMPFGDGFEDIDRIIGDAATECGLEYIRGDRRQQPGSVVSQIVHDIRSAAVVVADISHANPNVFYELGIAHQLLGPERVVIITQPQDKPPYDVHEFRQLIYHHNEAGREKLRKELPQCLRAAIETRAEREVWNVIRGRLSRTRLLVRDLTRLVESGEEGRLDDVVIRMVAGLGSLAISDHEPIDPAEGLEYKENLIAERDLVREALLHGARLRLVLNPPRRFTKAMLPERLRVRYERLIGLLEGKSDITDAGAAQKDLAAMARCEFALTSVPMPNLIIIGEIVAYEGMKRGGTRGFEMTHCETDKETLKDMIEQFDRLFDQSRTEMQRAGQPDSIVLSQLRDFYQEACRPTTAG